MIKRKFLSEQSFQTNSLVEEKGDKKEYFIEGIFMQGDLKNRNGRIYPTSILESQMNTFIQDKIKTKTSFGELDHPNTPNVSLKNASHYIVEMKKDGNNFYGKARIIEGHPSGDMAKSIILSGATLGVSTRGLGSLKESNGVLEVQDDFVLNTVDIVSSPSAIDAFVTGIMESADWVYDGSKFIEIAAEEAKQEIDKPRITEAELLNAFENYVSKISKQ